MYCSEILVVFGEDLVPSAVNAFEEKTGLSIELIYPLSRRAIVILETENGPEHVRRLRMLRALPQVLAASVRPGGRRATEAPNAFTQKPDRFLEPV